MTECTDRSDSESLRMGDQEEARMAADLCNDNGQYHISCNSRMHLFTASELEPPQVTSYVVSRGKPVVQRTMDGSGGCSHHIIAPVRKFCCPSIIHRNVA